MKISANEMLLINKNLKFKGEEAESASTVALAEVPEGKEDSISALNAQSMNNIAFQGVNMAGLKKMGLNAMVALTLLGGAASLQSCDDEPGGNTYIYDNTQVITNITVNIYMTDEELVKAVLEEIKALREEQKEQTAINKAILEALINQGISMDRILKLLEQFNMTAQDIFNMLKDNTEKQDQILNEMSKGNKEFKALLTEILNSIKDGNKLSAENNKTLTMILAQMGQADKNDQTVIALLNMILNKVNESIQTDKAIAMKQQMFFQAILGKLNAMDKHMQQGILALLNKIDSVSEKNLELLTKIFNSIQEGNQNDEKTNEILLAIFNKVQESIDQNHDLTEKTHEMLWMIMDKIALLNDDMKQGVLDLINNMNTISENNLALLTKIFNSINENNKNDEKTQAILMAIYDLTKAGIEQNHDLTEKTHEMLWMLMDKIDMLNDNMKTGFLAIIKNINEASQANIDLLLKLIVKVDNIVNAGDSNEKLMEVLNAILAKIEASIAQNKEMDSTTHQLLQTLIDNVQNLKGSLSVTVEKLIEKIEELSADYKAILNEILVNVKDMNENMQNGFASVVNRFDQMSAEQREFVNQILARLDKMDENGQKGLALILEQLGINNSISADMLAKIEQVLAKLDRANEADQKFYNQALALLAELISKVDQLGGKADSILDAIGNISLDVNVDLSTIERMLADILAQSKANGNVLTSIEGKMNLLAITLEGIKTQLEVNEADNKAILAKLDQILAKIPEKCNCNANLEVIIGKLDKIIENLKNGNNHEGVLDDLDDLFN